MTVDEKTALENALKQEPQMMARQALLKRLWKLSQCDQMKQKSPQDTTKALKSIKENRFIAGQSAWILDKIPAERPTRSTHLVQLRVNQTQTVWLFEGLGQSMRQH